MAIAKTVEKSAGAKPDKDQARKNKEAADKEWADILAAESGPKRKDFLTQVVALHTMNSELSQAIPGWRFPGIIRGDLVVYNAVAALGRATAEQVNEDVGEELKALGVLEAEKDRDSLAYITRTLKDKSKLKDKDGNKLRPLFTDHEDDTYSVVE